MICNNYTLVLKCICVLIYLQLYNALLIRRSLQEYPLSLCTNGQPASYYHSWDSSQNLVKSRKIIIYLQAGGYCHNVQTCKMRCKIAPYMCEPSIETVKQNTHGLLADDAEVNPYFYDYYKVMIPYCSADMYVGRRVESDETGGFNFLGRHILLDTMRSLQHKVDIYNAEDIVFAGSSAGGAGAAFNCDLMKILLPNVNIFCVVDGAFLYPISQSYDTQQQDECDTIDNVLESGSEFWRAPEIFKFDLHSSWWNKIKQPLFLSIARVDQFGFESYCGNESINEEQALWAEGTQKMAFDLTSHNSKIGFYMPACYDHMMLLDDVMFNSLPVGNHRLTLSTLLKNFVSGNGIIQSWDNCDPDKNVTFCNNGCPNLKATYKDMKQV